MSRPPPARNPTVAEAFASVDAWHKVESYFEVYDRYFAPLRGKPVKMLEIGVDRGGSIAGWKKYFGERKLDYTGIDINPNCSRFARNGVKIVIGDQMNVSLLGEVARAGPYDIVIDDGGHVTGQQIVSFEQLFPAVRDGGLYVVEDTHTSFWPSFHSNFTIGSTKVRGGFLDYAPLLIRSQMEFWWSPDSAPRSSQPRENRSPLDLGRHAKEIYAISFFDSMVVIEKRAMQEPLNIVR
jgi:hypothetical protein